MTKIYEGVFMPILFKAIVTSFAISASLAFPVIAQQETLIPRSVAGDKGKYYLLEAKQAGDIIGALHKRVGIDSVGYTETEINCKAMLIRDIGYSEVSPTQIKKNPSKWYELVPGSSKSDLANFVCKR